MKPGLSRVVKARRKILWEIDPEKLTFDLSMWLSLKHALVCRQMLQPYEQVGILPISIIGGATRVEYSEHIMTKGVVPMT